MSVCIDDNDEEAEELGVEVADVGRLLLEVLSSSSPSSSPPLFVLLKSRENEPASRCCTMCADGSVEFGEVTPKAQIKDSTVPPLFGMSKESIGLISED